MCGVTPVIESLTADELKQAKLAGSGESIPELGDLLKLGGSAPLLLELKKGPGPIDQLCAAVAEAIAGRGGPVGVMSFDADVGRWFAANAPAFPRGLVMDRPAAATRTEMLRTGDPEFIAVSVRTVAEDWVAELRDRLRVGCWTVRTAAERWQVAVHADALIWEGDGRP